MVAAFLAAQEFDGFSQQDQFLKMGNKDGLHFSESLFSGFIPFVLLAISCSAELAEFFLVFGCLGVLWFLVFIPCLPILFILEVVYLTRVLRNPELQARFGDRTYHIATLGIYAIAAIAAFVV